MQFVIVTGMSGAGKSNTLNIFEDLGYYCVDNLPPKLIQNLTDFCLEGSSDIERVALGIDIRGGLQFTDLFASLETLDARNLPYTILFLDAEDQVLLNRYRETRRNHPLSKRGDVIVGITEERKLIEPVRQRATYVLDTSMMLPRHVREKIIEIYMERKSFDIMIHIQSFGFKYGMPAPADLVFDVRFLRNPFYVPHLKTRTGLDEPVREYVMDSEVSHKFLRQLTDMFLFLVPQYIKEGRNQLVIAIGCTGGKHRSVTMAIGLQNALQNAGYSVIMNHRDITKTVV